MAQAHETRRAWGAAGLGELSCVHVARDSAIAVSIAMQFGAPLETIRSALTRDHGGGPVTLLGQAIDKIAVSP